MQFYILLICTILIGKVQAQTTFSAEKTYSPYFFVKTDDKSADVLPLKKTSTQVKISGVIASVEIRQTYSNTGMNPLEALYIFPASTRAAVHHMEMKIGDRVLEAQVQEKKQARQTYEKAKAVGKSTSLLEQKRPNIFQMNVAGIMPNETVEIILKYSELLIPENGIYEFVYPTVVAPRYSEKAQTISQEWVANPYSRTGELPSYVYDIRAEIQGGMPVHQIKCTSHKVDIKTENGIEIIQLSPDEKYGGNRDFILHYRLTDKSLSTGILLHEAPNEENYFMCMIQPPTSPTPSEIPPREYVFVLDVSGSMNGFPMQTARTLLRNLISKLRPTDRFNVLFFEGINRMFAPESVLANKKNIDLALDHIERHDGWGSTNLLPVLQTALNFKETQNYSRTFIVVTDGFITLEKEAFDLIHNNLNKANLFALGIGKSINRYLIEGMARAGQGVPFIVTKPEEANQKAEELRHCIQNPILTNIDMHFEGLQAYDVQPKKLPDVMANRPVLVFGKYKGNPTGTLTLRGLSGKKTTTLQINFAETKTTQNEAVKLLWARNKIAQLDDYGLLTNNLSKQATQNEVAQLGIKYNLLSSQTSFVAVDNQTQQKAKNITVHQALPMPEGLNNNIIGQNLSALPSEPPGNRRSGTTRSTAPIRIQLPTEISPILGNKVYLSWSTKDNLRFTGFQVNVLDMSDELLFQTQTSKTEIELNLYQGKLIDNDYFIFQIIPLNETGTPILNIEADSKMLQRAEEEDITKLRSTLNQILGDKQGTPDGVLEKALFFEKNGYISDAMRIFRQLIAISSDEKYQVAFQKFLKRNQF